MSDHGALGYDVRAEVEVECRDDGSRHHIRPEEPLEAHAAGEHGNDLRVACQFGSEEDDGDEDEKRAEEVGEVGHEVGIVVKDDCPERCMVGCELRQVLVDVEDDGNRDNKCDRIEVCADELGNNIPVELVDHP